MAKSNSIFRWGALFFAIGVLPAAAADTPRLSAAQSAVIANGIAKLNYQQEQTLASHWSDAKKVAEFICRPLATAVLKRRSNADRVFLGADDPGALHLLSDRQLAGGGQYRAGDSWQTFTFSCTLDPRTGTAVAFETKPAGELAPK